MSQRGDGYGNDHPRAYLQRQDMDAVGLFRLEFPAKFSTFVFQQTLDAGGVGSAVVGDLYVSFGSTNLSRADTPSEDNLTDVLDPLSFPVVRLQQPTDTIYVAVMNAKAGEQFRAYALHGGAEAAHRDLDVTISGQPVSVDIAAASVGSLSVAEALADNTPTVSEGVVSVGTSSIQVVASNTSRTDLVVQNHGADPVALKWGTTAVFASQGIILDQYQTFNFRQHGIIYTGVVHAIRDSGAATANVGFVELD